MLLVKAFEEELVALVDCLGGIGGGHAGHLPLGRVQEFRELCWLGLENVV